MLSRREDGPRVSPPLIQNALHEDGFRQAATKSDFGRQRLALRDKGSVVALAERYRLSFPLW